MKKLLSVILTASLLISCSANTYAASVNESFSSGGLGSLKSVGSVSIVENPADIEDFSAKIASGSDSDSYLYVPSTDFTQGISIAFKFYVPEDCETSKVRLYLRDDKSISNNVVLIYIGAENISFTNAGSDPIETAENTWYNVRIIFDFSGERVLYRLSCDTDPDFNCLKEYSLDTFLNYNVHNFTNTTLRFSLGQNTTDDYMYFDDISVTNIQSSESLDKSLYIKTSFEKSFDGSFLPVSSVSDGAFRFAADLENYAQTDKELTLLNVHYGADGRMKGFYPSSVTLKAIGSSSAENKFTLKDCMDGDYIKAFIWDSTDNICPKTNALTYDLYTANYIENPSFSQKLIDACASASLPTYRNKVGGNATVASAFYYSLLVEHMHPGTQSSDGTYLKDKALSSIRNLIAGGNEPFASVGCYWTHPIITASMVMAKNTPTVWNELTNSEKERIDWLMRAMAIAGNWGFNDLNDYKTGFNLTGNFRKTWNPNYRNAYLSVVISSAQYFGADALDEIFVNFDYDTYIEKLTELGYTNILSTWTVAGKDLMENGGSCVLVGNGGDDRYAAGDDGGSGAGVKIPFTYSGYTLRELEHIFANLMCYTYSEKVVSSVAVTDDYTAGIDSGKTSPYEGLMGMMKEFNAGDGGGKRSSSTYCLDSAISVMPTYANMKLFGNWKSELTYQAETDELIFVGTEDFIFKVEEGYRNYSLGQIRGTHKVSADSTVEFNYVKDIWRAFHMTKENPYV